MPIDVLCLRPEADFTRVGVRPNPKLRVMYRGPADPDVGPLLTQASALVIPAVGPKLATSLFENAPLKLVQVTGAGVDRLDQEVLTRKNIPVANVAGGSNSAVAEYAVTSASFLLMLLIRILILVRGDAAPRIRSMITIRSKIDAGRVFTAWTSG